MIRSLAQLTECLAALPQARPGYRRVYRGQTTDHGAMIPSGLRPGAPHRNRMWDLALKPLTDKLSGVASGDVALENVAYWYKVIAQHYGPGSPFLDVTSSPEVALWFALHVCHKNDVARFSLTQGDVELPIECPTLHFTAHAGSNGWLYVLDVPVWDGSGVPRHGEFVDLADGPDFVAQAPRVRRQAGCLVAAEESGSDGDLVGFYACEPIAVGQPFEGVPLLEREPAWLFPSPQEDDWYRLLLRAPLIPLPSEDTGYAYQQSLGVYLIAPDAAPEHAAPYIDLQTKHLNPLTRIALRVGTSERELQQITGGYPEAATCICLESPLLGMTPPVSSGLWNQSLLVTGLQAATQPQDTTSRALLHPVSLENVLVEFSPLEWAFLEGPDDGNRVPRQWRSLWLLRKGDSFLMTLFVTSEPGGKLEIDVLRVEYSRRDHMFFAVNGDRVPLAETAEAKPFFVTLVVLRDLSLSVKPEPFLSFSMGDTTGVLAVRGPTAILARPMRDAHDLRLHFVRYLHSGAPYEGPPSQSEVGPAGQLFLDLSVPFESLGGLNAVYARVREAQLSSGHTVHLPEPDASGCSEGAVRTLRRLFPTNPEKEPSK